jgi:hypothetical protein
MRQMISPVKFLTIPYLVSAACAMQVARQSNQEQLTISVVQMAQAL